MNFPYLGELAAAVSHEGGLGGCDDDFEFEFGLDLVLEGLDRRRSRLAMQVIDRRTFIADLGRGAFALAVVGLAACSPGTLASARPSRRRSHRRQPRGRRRAGSEPSASSAAGSPSAGNPPARDGLTWQRVDLGFVSAYVLVRGGQAVVVDTGVGGSAGAIEDSLVGVGLDWSAVGHLILTHRHNDHVGSAAEVMEAAPMRPPTPAPRTSRRSAFRGRSPRSGMATASSTCRS